MRIWPLTIVACVGYTLLLSFTMVHIASRSVCLLGVRKNALGATVLSLAAGLPDLISVVVLCGRPGMEQMAASNAFGAYAFNAFVALGLPWTVLGLYSDVFPPARGTWYPAAVGFVCVAIALAALAGCRFRMHRPLGGGLLMLMAVGIGGMFVPVTSAWYPILHNVYLYGALTLFTLYIAYDTQKMIDEYEMGEDDHIKHATDLFIDFKIVFSRVLQLLMMSRD